jgi:hypothetical protein
MTTLTSKVKHQKKREQKKTVQTVCKKRYSNTQNMQFKVVEISERSIFLEWDESTQGVRFELHFSCDQRPLFIKACCSHWQNVRLPTVIQDLILDYYLPTGDWTLKYTVYHVGPSSFDPVSSCLHANGSADVVLYASEGDLHLVWNWFCHWLPNLQVNLSKTQRQMLDIVSRVLIKFPCPKVVLGREKDSVWGTIKKENFYELLIELETYNKRARNLTKLGSGSYYSCLARWCRSENTYMVISKCPPAGMRDWPVDFEPLHVTVYFEEDNGRELRYF